MFKHPTEVLDLTCLETPTRVIHIAYESKSSREATASFGFQIKTLNKQTVYMKLVVTGVNPFIGKQGRRRGKTYDWLNEWKWKRLDLVETGSLGGRSHGVAGNLIGCCVNVSWRGVEALQVCGVIRCHGVADLETLLLVGFEHVGEAETLSTYVTGVWLLASVRAAVTFHIGPARETLSTDLTDIWFLSWSIIEE